MYSQTWRTRKSAVLYDAGGWFIIPIMLGVPIVGLLLDYFWNYLALSLSTRWAHVWVDSGRKHCFCLIVTPVGLVIDWIYYKVVWGGGMLFHPALFPGSGGHQVIEVATILAPMAILLGEYVIMAELYLHWDFRRSVRLGAIMGALTSPWLILGYFLLHRYS